MDLQKLQEELDSMSYSTSLKQVINEAKKTAETRLYLNISREVTSYFIIFESKPFLKVFIQRPKDFNYAGYKQTEDDNTKCKNAKFKILNALSDSGISGIEHYNSSDETQITPKSSAKKIDL